jgi:hypothetical protein
LGYRRTKPPGSLARPYRAPARNSFVKRRVRTEAPEAECSRPRSGATGRSGSLNFAMTTAGRVGTADGHSQAGVTVVRDESGADLGRFVVREAWPVNSAISDLNAKGNEVLIELLELANDGIERVS